MDLLFGKVKRGLVVGSASIDYHAMEPLTDGNDLFDSGLNSALFGDIGFDGFNLARISLRDCRKLVTRIGVIDGVDFDSSVRKT